MGIKEQMMNAENIEQLKMERININNKVYIMRENIESTIQSYRDSILKEIKEKILAEGQNNNFEISDKGQIWSMSYKGLQYKGNFSSKDINVLERENGESYLKIEFVVHYDERLPDSGYSMSLPANNELEQQKLLLAKDKEILEKYKKFEEELNIKNMIIEYQSGKKDTLRLSLNRTSQQSQNPLTKIGIDELVRMIIG